MPTRTILVVGATGAQGGSVARHLLGGRAYSVRCLTRNPESPAALALKAAGAEVYRGDLADAASVRQALAGCYGCFAVTNYWEHFDLEYEHGMNLINAVRDAVASEGFRHLVFSTLPSPSKISGGAITVPHFEIKARLEHYARSQNLPATFVHVAFYYENFLSYFPPRRQADGNYVFAFPQGDTPLAACSVADTGGVVHALFRLRDDYLYKTVGIVGDDLPPAEYARIMSRVTGRPIRYQHVPADKFAALGFPGAADLAAMFDFNRNHIPNRRADLMLSRSLYPDMQNFETWLRANQQRFLAALSG